MPRHALAAGALAAGCCLSAGPAPAADPHVLEEVLVSAPLASSAADTALPVSLLSGETLQRQAAATLGDTLARLPGVSSAAFGTAVGQPVIRGQGGGRVSVLANGLATADAAAISPDHANSSEPLLAERIEVIRGPATLLHGSGAIGGIVNVIDNRIPERVPERTTVALEQRHDTGNDGNTTVLRADGGQGRTAWHIDGVYRDSGDLGIPGLPERFPDEPARHGVLANADLRARAGTAGLSQQFGNGSTGLAWQHLENDYGIPGHTHAGEAPVRIALQQDRLDWRGELRPGWAGTQALRASLAWSDYTHREYAGAVTGTVFRNETTEARLEWLHAPLLGWEGLAGLQLQDRNVAATGDEAFVPVSDIRSSGLFWMGHQHRGDWVFETGLRVDDQHIDASGFDETRHQALSASASLIRQLGEAHALVAALSRSERAPAIEELFSHGVHAATASYEQGDPQLDTETAWNLELGYRYEGRWHLSANTFYNRVQDYITAHHTGLLFNADSEAFETACSADHREECLPVFRYVQNDGVFYGYELEAGIPLPVPRGERLELVLYSDSVRGRLDDNGDAPRLPPLRYGAALQWDWQAVHSELRFTRAREQNRAGAHETQTGGYTLLDAHIDWRAWQRGDREVTLFLRGLNLLDDTVRHSSAYVRDSAPEAGRRIEAGFRLRF